jgi:hypothetical protein
MTFLSATHWKVKLKGGKCFQRRSEHTVLSVLSPLSLSPFLPSTSGGRFHLRWRKIFINKHGLIYIKAYWMTVIHIPFTQFNVIENGLGYYIILTFSLYPSLWMKVYNIGPYRLRDKFEVIDTWTDCDIQYRRAHSCLHLADIGCNR